MLAVKIIISVLCAILFALAALYFFNDSTYNTKAACICFAFAILFTCTTSRMYHTLQLQNQPVYQKFFEDELIRTDTLCYKDGTLYDTQFFGESNLVIKDKTTGFYRIYVTRATREGPRKIIPDLCCDSETIINIDKNCRQPTVKEYIRHEYRIKEGEIYFQRESPKFILTIPLNSLKVVDSFQGS